MGEDPATIAALFREGSSVWDARCSVGWGAAHAVLDAPSQSPRFVKYRPFNRKLTARED